MSNFFIFSKVVTKNGHHFREKLPPSPFANKEKPGSLEELSGYQRNWIAAAMAYHGYDVPRIKKILGISTEIHDRTLRRWRQRFEGVPIREEKGRRPYLNAEDLEALRGVAEDEVDPPEQEYFDD